jgi:hypothetical protein
MRRYCRRGRLRRHDIDTCGIGDERRVHDVTAGLAVASITCVSVVRPVAICA